MNYFRCVPPHDRGVQFFQIYPMPKYPKAGITCPTDNFYARLTPDWI